MPCCGQYSDYISIDGKKGMDDRNMMELPGITREDEERHLAYVIDVAQNNLENNRNGVEALKGELHELLETYGAKDTEALAMWHNTVAMLEETKTDLLRSEKARKKP